jgi:hypothetical protein
VLDVHAGRLGHPQPVEGQQRDQRVLGSRFDQAFSAGSGFTQREAVAIVRDQGGTPAP